MWLMKKGQRSPKRIYPLAQAHSSCFGNFFLVECPACAQTARVESERRPDLNYKSLRCVHCGYTHDGKFDNRVVGKNERLRLSGAARDPSYGHKLVIQAPFRAQIFWAYNWEHLESLENLVRADLRPGRPPECRSNFEQTPKWILLRRNREGILRLIHQLRARKI